MLNNVLFYRKNNSNKAETIPFLNATLNGSPPAPTQISTSTVNRTLLHNQQNHGGNGLGTSTRKATAGTLRGLAIINDNESPPPDYKIVVHDTRRHDLFYYVNYSIFISLNVLCKSNKPEFLKLLFCVLSKILFKKLFFITTLILINTNY